MLAAATEHALEAVKTAFKTEGSKLNQLHKEIANEDEAGSFDVLVALPLTKRLSKPQQDHKLLVRRAYDRGQVDSILVEVHVVINYDQLENLQSSGFTWKVKSTEVKEETAVIRRAWEK